jgi:hypothetical protein
LAGTHPGHHFSLWFMVLLVTTILLGVRIMRTRLHLPTVRTRDQLLEVFAQSRLQHLASRILDLAPSERPFTEERIVIQSPLNAGRAAREFAHLYKAWLARTHFFTAFAVLLAIAALSWGQHQTTMLSEIALPPLLPTLGAALTLALLGILSWAVIDAASKLLFEKITELPLERVEMTWLRALATLCERVGSTALPSPVNNSITGMGELLEPLKKNIDGDLRVLSESILRFSAATEAFAGTVKAFSDSPRVQTELQAVEKLEELNAAVGLLTAKMDRLTAARPLSATTKANGADTNSEGSSTLDRGTRQRLRDLLEEFE